MLTFRVFWFGRPKANSPEAEICARFQKRVQSWAHLEEIVLKPTLQKAGQAELARKAEQSAFLKKFDPRDFLIVLDERAKPMTSKAFAQVIQHQALMGASRISLLIGGSYGVHPNLLQRANLGLSFGKMTLSHGLARILLFEQLYRAMAILNNHPYHHEE